MKRWFLLLIVVILVLFTSCSSNAEPMNVDNNIKVTVEDSSAVKEEVIQISIMEYRNAFDENSLAADKNFRNKIFEVTGKVGNIAEGDDVIYITLTEDSGWIICGFESDHLDEILELKTGDIVTIRGRSRGNLNFEVGDDLGKCTFVSTNTGAEIGGPNPLSSSDAVVMSDFMIITAKIAAEMITDDGGEYQFLATESDGQGFMEYRIDKDNSIILITDGIPDDYTTPGYQMVSAVSVYPSETTANIMIYEDVSIYMNIDDLYNAFGKSNVDFKPDPDFDGAFTATVLTDYGEIICSWQNDDPNYSYPDMLSLRSLDY